MHAPGGDDNPYTLSFRGLDNSVYYMTEQGNGAHLLNYSGCGNTVSANHPVVKQLIIDSLRMYVAPALPQAWPRLAWDASMR